MGAVIGEILGEAVGVAISPLPIIAIVLLLSSSKGRSNAFAFLLGWLAGLAVVGTLVLLLADPAGASTDSGPAKWVGWLVLALGALCVLLGIRQFRGRPRGGEEAPLPKWMTVIDQFTPGRSLAIGFALAAINPKNTTLTLAASAAIAGAGLDTAASFVVLAVFVLIGTLGLFIPFAIYLLGGDKAADTLQGLRHWLAINNAAIMAVLFVVIGAKLIGSGLQTIA
ncbi:MAG TPA: GAP family protein [Acidimicrobiia bacterium]|jgi:threonine/homoserine/homoserine lactone efflux protein